MSTLNDARTLGEVLRLNATLRPDKIAFQTTEGRSVTFGQFNERVNRLNHAVSALGVQKGARVAILSRNRTEYIETYGIAKSGLIVVPLNWRLSAVELTRVIENSGAEMLLVDELHRDLAERIREDLRCVRHFVSFGAPVAGWHSYDQLIAAGRAQEPESLALPGDVLCVIYTSGTTGDPKGVAITHGAAMGNCRTAATEMLRIDAHDRTMAVMPLFHVGGMWYHLFPSFASGATTLILSDFAPALVLKELEGNRITNVHLVPTMIGALLGHPSAATTDLRHLRLMFYAASSMPARLLSEAMQTFSQCGFTQSYGSTEAGVLTVLDPDDHRRARDAAFEHLLLSCGRPLPGRQVRIIDEAGHTVVAGGIGEIEVQSPGVMQGYWLNEPATRNALHGRWLKTGDLGYLDAEGYLYLIDRKHDMIVTGGENVFPTEIEAQLYRERDVLEAAVFGIPDPLWVEKVVAAVILKTGSHLTGEDLITRLRTRLAPYKCPKAIFFVQSLPKSAAGKVLRKELRRAYASPEPT